MIPVVVWTTNPILHPFEQPLRGFLRSMGVESIVVEKNIASRVIVPWSDVVWIELHTAVGPLMLRR